MGTLAKVWLCDGQVENSILMSKYTLGQREREGLCESFYIYKLGKSFVFCLVAVLPFFVTHFWTQLGYIDISPTRRGTENTYPEVGL